MYHQRLISKFLSGEITDSEIILLEKWLQADPENRRIFDFENELWQLSYIHKNKSYYEIDKTWNKFIQDRNLKTRHGRALLVLHRNRFRFIAAATVISCMLAFGSFYLKIAQSKFYKEKFAAVTSIVTREGEKSLIILPDSSEIYLNAGSSVNYDGHFNLHDRSIALSGEAFFNVRTNLNQPFKVFVDKIIITATGTAFNVSSYTDDDRIETTLEQGSIFVTMEGYKDIVLQSGQQLIYFRNTDKLIVRDVITETYTSWMENKLRFIDTPLDEVLRKLSRNYDVDFEILHQEVLEQKYTATFIDESIEDIMELLKAVSPLDYKIYHRTSPEDKKYTNPKIVVGLKKSVINSGKI